MVKRFSFLIIVTFVISCSGPVNFEKDLVGIWRSKDGAVLIINNDSTFSVKNLPADLMALSNGHAVLAQQEKTLLTYDGAWEVSTWYGDERISLRPQKRNVTGKAYENIGLFVFRSGFLQNRSPNSIQIYLDSDGTDIYQFTRTPTVDQ